MRKIWILLIPTLALCFTIGFMMGAYPQASKKFLGQEENSLTLLTSDSKLIPMSSLLAFEKATGVPVKLREIPTYHLFRTEAAQADLLFAPLGWLKQFPDILRKFPEDQILHDKLSSDFQSLQLGLEYFLPILWKVENRKSQHHLKIWGFATTKENSPALMELLNSLMDNGPRLSEWAITVPDLSFTLEISNKLPDFPENQKAQKFREVSLPDLQIETQP